MAVGRERRVGCWAGGILGAVEGSSSGGPRGPGSEPRSQQVPGAAGRGDAQGWACPEATGLGAKARPDSSARKTSPTAEE